MTRFFCLLAPLALSACASVPPPSSSPAVAQYRAVGTEPFWSLELTGSQMRFTEANAPGKVIAEAQPRAIHGFAGDIYQGRRINLNIVHGVGCSDGMSDRRYSDRVQVRVDDRSFEGCGGEVAMPAELAGTNWTVVSVDGRPSPAGDRYGIRFDGDRISARFGCNAMSGRYQVRQGVLTVGGLVATRMACADMRDEMTAGRVLGAPVELEWGPGERMTLRNAGGAIVLRRAI